MWFIDSSCSNHMTCRKDWFSFFDISFSDEVKVGNNYSLKVAGKGTVRPLMKLCILLVMFSLCLNWKIIYSACDNFKRKDWLLTWSKISAQCFEKRGLIFKLLWLLIVCLLSTLNLEFLNLVFRLVQYHSQKFVTLVMGIWAIVGWKLLEFNMMKGIPSFKSLTHLCEHCLKRKH